VRNILGLSILGILLFTFTSCNNIDYGVKVNASTVRWNDTNYILIGEEVKPSDIGEELGKIKKTVSGFPKENFEANNDINVGVRLYKINNEDSSEAIDLDIPKKHSPDFTGLYIKAVIISHISSNEKK
jgi:hypothetical protein